MNLHHWFTTPLRDLHEVIYTFLWDLHDSRFTTFQKGKDSICNFWEDEVHIDVQQNSRFVFQNIWKRFEATLHLLIICKKHRERSQKRRFICERFTFQTKRENWKYCQISYLFCFASLTTFPSTSVWIANVFFHFNKIQFIDAR